MSTDIKFGVVIDNRDVNETGKIRVLEITELPSDYRNKSIIELKTLLGNLDVKGNHIPWQKGTYAKNPDPYLADAFLPKQINIIPQEGQLVKLVTYSDANFKEYVGPHISSLENQKENYVNSINSFKIVSKKDLIKKGFVNKVGDTGIFGNNSQIILGNKELFLRTNFQKTDTKSKNTSMALFQQSTFDKTLSIETKTKSKIVTPEIIISHLLRIKINKDVRVLLNDKTIHLTATLSSVLNHKNSDGKLGITNNSFNPKNEYGTDTEIEFEMFTDDVVEVNNFITGLKSSLLSKTVPQLSTLVETDNIFQTTITTPTYDLTIKDYRKMRPNFTVITDRKEVDVMSMIITVDKDQKIYEVTEDALSSLGIPSSFIKTSPKFYAKEQKNLVLINTIIAGFQNNHKVETKLFDVSPKAVLTEFSESKSVNKIDSFTVNASHKILNLSTQITPNLISDDVDRYGLNQKDLAELVDPSKLNTFSSIRGERLLAMINILIDLFIAHGHSTGVTVKNSIEDDTKNKLIKMKEELNKKVNQDLTGGADLLNQYIRIN